jgi:hypothetical protein
VRSATCNDDDRSEASNTVESIRGTGFDLDKLSVMDQRLDPELTYGDSSAADDDVVTLPPVDAYNQRRIRVTLLQEQLAEYWDVYLGAVMCDSEDGSGPTLEGSDRSSAASAMALLRRLMTTFALDADNVLVPRARRCYVVSLLIYIVALAGARGNTCWTGVLLSCLRTAQSARWFDREGVDAAEVERVAAALLSPAVSACSD